MARRQRTRGTILGDPWYAEGLRFHCTACGACCTGAPGYVWVTAPEIDAMAKAKGMTPAQFRKRFVRRVRGRLSLRERENGDCVMLEGERCSVYEAKPVRCSTFPFWPEVLESRDDWEETATRCEGIDRGPHYSRGEIERIAAGDPRPLLRKQDEEPLPAEVQPARPAEPSEARWAAAFRALESLYEELARELPRYRFTCAASGDCCDFDAYGHRLYATTLEVEYFFRHGGDERVNDDERACPAWGPDRLCKARQGRMLGCRSYFCGPYPVIPPDDVYERYYRRIKELHTTFGIPFAYRDIRAWAAERAPAGGGGGRTSEASSR